MAVLNKIRQRSIFLIIVIALALFSFVIGDVLNNLGQVQVLTQLSQLLTGKKLIETIL